MSTFKAFRQIQSAISLLSPEEVRSQAERPLKIGLLATSSSGYADMEDFLAPAELSPQERRRRMERIFQESDQESDADTGSKMDLYLCEEGLPCPASAFTFHRSHPEATVEEIVEARDDLRLALAHTFEAFRKPVVDRIVYDIAK